MGWVTRIDMAWLTAAIVGLLLPAWKGALAGVPLWGGFLGLLLIAEFGAILDSQDGA